MSRTLLAAVAALALAPPGLAAPAPATKPAAELPLPGKTLVALQVNGHGRVRERLKVMLQKAAPDLAPKVAAHLDALEQSLQGGSLEPLRPDGRVGVAILNFAGGEPEAVALLPMTDFAAFRSQVLPPPLRKSYEKGRRFDTFEPSDNKTLYVADMTKEGYVAVATTQEAAEAVVASGGRMTAAAMGPAAAELFLNSDAAVYVHMERINELYGAQIRQFRQLMQALMQPGGPLTGKVDASQVETIRKAYDSIFQGVEDAQGFALGIDVRPEGAALKLAMAFAADTESRKLLAGETPGEITLLDALPAGQVTYLAARVGPKLAPMFSGASAEFGVGEEDDDRAKAAFEAYAEAVAGLKGFATAASPPDGGLAVWLPDDPKAAVAAKLKAFKALKPGMRYSTVPVKRVRVADETRKASGFELHEVALEFDFEAALKNTPEGPAREAAEAAMKRMAQERVTMWFGTDGKTAVSVAAKDWPAAEAQLAAFAAKKSPATASPSFRATLAQLPREASLVSLTDVGKMFGALGGVIGDVMGKLPLPGGKAVPKLGTPPKVDAYLGVALVARPGDIRGDLFVPAEAVAVVRAVFQPLVDAAGKGEE